LWSGKPITSDVSFSWTYAIPSCIACVFHHCLLVTVTESTDVVKIKHADGTKTLNGFRVTKEVLGTGSFAKVKLCEQESTADRFAIKVFRKLHLRRQRDFVRDDDEGGMKVCTSLDKAYEEIAIMKQVLHPNCLRLYAVLDEPDPNGKLYLVIELAAKGPAMEWDSEKCSYLVPATGSLVGESTAKSYVHDTLRGLRHLHSCRIAHRDIKPQNLLVDADGRLKIGDFGAAVKMLEDFLVNGTEGTYYFFSPEMCSSGYKGHDGRRADIWATGVSMWAFLFGSLPFFHADLVSLLDSIAVGRYQVPTQSGTFSEECHAFLCRLLTVDPAQRSLTEELLRDVWLSSSGERATGTDIVPRLPTRAGYGPEATLLQRRSSSVQYGKRCRGKHRVTTSWVM